MDAAHKSRIDKLKALAGARFSLFERYANGGENAELKGFAAKTLPHLQMHLKMAEDLRK